VTPQLLALQLLAPAEAPAPASEAKPAPTEQAIERETNVRLDQKTKRKFKRTGSKQRFEIEFKMGPYLPDVDRDYEGPGLGPYATIFGETNSMGVAIDQPKQFPMPAFAFEYQIVYLAGPLGLAVQLGFFRDKARALLTQPMEGDTSVRSEADDVTFGMVPIALQAVYRFEYGADRARIPLVPYAKFGPAYAFWWTKSGSGNIARTQDSKGIGGVWGFQLNAGGMLRLDFLEPSSAKRLDQLTGINHTYIFGEFQLTHLDNFGAKNSISLGDATWFAGLAIEF
jgi:hypothetical protein